MTGVDGDGFEAHAWIIARPSRFVMSMHRLVRVVAAGVLATLGACGRGSAPAATTNVPLRLPPGFPRNGLEVIGGMRWAHPSRELRSLAFTITTTQYVADSSTIGRSRVYAALPGKLRVEQLPSNRTGYVRVRQRVAVFERGRRVSTLSRVDLSVLLAYDVFAQAIDTTIMWLDSARVRFGLLRRDELEGRTVWVVGALEGDTTSAQFWVDAERWRVLRVIQREPRTPAEISDLRFTDFTDLLDVPVPTQIRLYRAGKLVQQQEISNLVANPSLPSRAFDLSRWRPVNLGN
jgi:hypothetical protein